MKVEELIVQSQMLWNLSKLKGLLHKRDVDLIMKIPLTFQNVNDGWIWFRDKSRSYSIRSSCRLLCQDISEANPQQIDSVWSILWKIKTPPKMLQLMWRVLLDCLPTGYALTQRHIPLDTISCPICGIFEETTKHILLECSLAKSIWRIVGLYWQGLEIGSVKDWFMIMMSQRNWEVGSRIVAICWSLWWNRNEVAWRGNMRNVRGVLVIGLGLLEAWKKAQDC